MEPLRLYLKDIKDIPLLTAEQELFLARKIRKGDAKARRHMIQSNLRLVINLAKKYSHFGVSMMDLIEEGNLGLIKAVHKYDHRMGYRFSTYAAWWIKQYITRAIANQSKTIRIPIYMAEIVHRWNKTTEHLAQVLSRRPTLRDIAKEMKLPLKKAREISKLIAKTTSLNMPVGEGDTGELIDLIEDESSASPSEEVSSFLQHEHIASLLDKMDEREREVLTLRFGLKDGLSRTLAETAKYFGLTRERVRQIENTAMKRLKVLISQIEKKEGYYAS